MRFIGYWFLDGFLGRTWRLRRHHSASDLLRIKPGFVATCLTPFGALCRFSVPLLLRAQIREGNAARIREVTEALSVGLGDADIHLNGSFRA
jgi:hypothetical protein